MDEVVAVPGPLDPPVARRSRTRKLPLRGAEGYESAVGLDPRLAERYGGETGTLLAMIDDDATLGEPLVPGLPYLAVEAVYAARHEMVRTLDDVLSRRTRARLLARDASAAAAPAVAALIAGELGWSADEQRKQVESYQASIEHERNAAGLPLSVTELVGGG